MIEEIIQNADQLTFAVLFVAMLVYTIKTNDNREKRYQDTIKDNQEMVKDALHRMKEIRDVKKDTEEIKKKVG